MLKLFIRYVGYDLKSETRECTISTPLVGCLATVIRTTNFLHNILATFPCPISFFLSTTLLLG